jgi:hypothetical protein
MFGNLVIGRVGIHETQQLVLGYAVNQLIDSWKGKPILRVGFIQVNVINKDPPLPIGFFLLKQH